MKKVLLIISVIVFFSTNLLQAEKRVWRENPFNSSVLELNNPANKTNKAKRLKKRHNLILQGIWVVDKKPKAMISDIIVYKGSKINNYIVRRIYKDKVILRSKDTRKNMELKFN